MLEQIISIDCKDGIKEMWGFRVMVFNATFNDISVISRWSVLFVEKFKLPEKTTDLLQVTDKRYYIM
jgi:hypothetical protein